MRRTAAEKYEVIRLVEGSDLPVRQTLRELQVNRSTFYVWYHRYADRGRAGLQAKPSAARRYWNRIPARVRQRVVKAALADPERSPRELAWQLTDREGHFLSESSVYRILKAYDLIPSLQRSSDMFRNAGALKGRPQAPRRTPAQVTRGSSEIRTRAYAHVGGSCRRTDGGDRVLHHCSGEFSTLNKTWRSPPCVTRCS